MKHYYTGKSILELKKENPKLFWGDWFKDENFAKEHPKKGWYEIKLVKAFDKTFKEQKKECPRGFEVAHPAVVLEAIFDHYKKTGKRLLSDWYVRTSWRVSSGGLVGVGPFGSGGVCVCRARPDYSGGSLGVSFSRSLDILNLDPLNSEVEITEVRINGKTYKLVE